ncbi:tape measure protein [Spirosoma flavus]
MERRVLGLTTTTVRESAKVDSALQNIGRLALGAFAFRGLSDLPQQIVKVRGEMERLEISLSVLLRSKSQADDLLGKVVKFAGSTPFSVKDAADGAKQLLAYGFSAKEIIPTLSKLGDVAAGMGLPLERLVYLFGTTRTSGRLMTKDLNQFTDSGIPLIKELAKQFGVAEDKIRGMAEEGKFGFKEVKKAIEDMTSGTGLFSGTLEAQSKSINALKERLGDAYEQMLNQIGKDNQDIIAGILNGATEAVTQYDSILDILKILVATYGAYRAAVLATSVIEQAADLAKTRRAALLTAEIALAQSKVIITREQAIAEAQAASATGFLTLSQIKLAEATALASEAQAASAAIAATNATKVAASATLAARAQAFLNSTILANPYALAVAAIVAVTTALVIYKSELTGVEKAEEALKKAREDAATETDKERAKVELLRSTINNEKLTREARNKALKELIDLSPDHLKALTLENVKTTEGTTAINDYIEALARKIEKQKLDAELVEHLSRRNDALNNKNETGFFSNLLTGAALSEGAYNGDVQQAQADKKRRLNKEIAAEEQVIIDKILERNRALDEAGKAAVKSETAAQAAKGKTIEQIDQEIEEIKKKINTANTDAQNARYRKDIDALLKQKRRLTGELTTEEKRQQREADKVGPFGSISYFENVAKKSDEILQKLVAGKDDAKIAEYLAKKQAAEYQAEELRKKQAIKSFEEELSEKETKYLVYENLLTAYGKESADAQFQDLLKSGTSYLDFLNNQISQLEDQRTNVGLTDKEAGNLSQLIEKRNAVTGQKTSLDLFVEGLRKAQVESVSLTDYLNKLYEKQEALNKTSPLAPDFFKKKEAVATEIVQAEQQLKDFTNQFLQSSASNAEAELAIKRKYNDLKLGLDKKYNNETTADYYKALADINTKEAEELEEFKKRKFEEGEAYKATTKIILEEGQKGLKIRIANQRAVVEDAKSNGGINTEFYKEQLRILRELEKEAEQGSSNILNVYVGAVGQFGQALSQLGGDAAVAGNLLVGLSSTISTVVKAMKEGLKPSERLAIGIQGLMSLINDFNTASEQRKKVDEDYYNSIISRQQQYNLLLNEQLGLTTQNRNNIFGEDYLGKINNNYKKLNDAQVKYQQSIRKLAEGQAKVGTRDSLNAGKALSGALSGAAIGTAILPGVGTVVGAAAGFIGSLFGSAKEKQEEFASLLRVYPDLIKEGEKGVYELNSALAESLVKSAAVDDKTKELIQSTLDWKKQIDEAKVAIKDIVKSLVGDLGGKLGNSLVEAFKLGQDAAVAFKGTLEEILEDFTAKLIYSKVLMPYLEKFGDEVAESLGPNGDGRIDDDTARLYEKAPQIIKATNDLLQQAMDGAKQMGFDILKNKNLAPNTGSGPNSATNAIRGVTEETAGLLLGQFNAFRIGQADATIVMRQQLLSLNNIETNTARLERTNELLSSVDNRLKNLESNDPLRGIGIPK